jgi:hypothetical protein
MVGASALKTNQASKEERKKERKKQERKKERKKRVNFSHWCKGIHSNGRGE